MARLAGIDITSRHVRVAIVRTSYRRVAVEALLESTLTDEASIVPALQTLLGRTRVDATAVALPGDRCFYRRLELPATAQKELDNVLAFELESSIPFEMEGAVYDHRILARPPGPKPVDGEGAELVVFAAVSRTNHVKERIDIVKEATGREPDSVDPGSITLANLALVVPELVPPGILGAPPAPVAVLDLGSERSELVFLDRGEPSFARMISRGTSGLPQSASALGRELKQSFAAWRAVGGAPPEALYLVGEGSHISGAEAYLTAVVEVPVKQLPKMRLEVAPSEEPRLPSFAKAIALALSNEGKSRSLNLRRGVLEQARSFAFLREKLPLLSGLAAVVFVSFGFSVVAEMRALSTERALLDEQLKATTRDVFGEETSDIARATELLEKGPGGEEDPMPQADAFDVMVQFSKSVPKDVVHDVQEFDVARGHVVIQGLVPDGTDAQQTAETIADGMKENPCFKDVKVSKVTQASGEKQKYILELNIQCEEKKKPAAGAKPETKEKEAAP
ncbi:MAG: pilus assembly protein PilM [Polyangiaceae bacterium]|nr:pilus assembly protein PilM [Polyangiaceae bacterium]